MNKLNFVKMHGLGNDFVIIDRRNQKIIINENIISKIGDRKTGAGCDQIIVLEKSSIDKVDGKISIYNSSGDQVEACGNGTRCVAKILFEELNKKDIQLESPAGILNSQLNENGSISVNMGKVKSNWRDIPLVKEMDTRNIDIKIKNFSKGTAVNLGNPHVVFFGNNLNKINLNIIGPSIENHSFFANKTNVEFVEIINKNKILMRVWERSVGETLACGSGACAAVYAGFIKNLNTKNCEVVLQKGSLFISIKDNDEIILTGPAETSFFGSINY